ncbi:MAG TPA: efflux RND transporter periplasmic adaptor subunit [Pirellulales bacterium]|jgi:RND family efflux transporter MFP subunit|nr:efflux RND transporter periplasmic adaptor subunit [Pirellulales bacterium]
MRRYTILAFWVILGPFVGCSQGNKATAPKADPPAKVAHVANEEQVNTIVLTAAAEARLGLTTAAVERRSMRRTRTYGGEVALPPGASIIVSAPVAGTLLAPKEGVAPAVGARVVRRQPMFLLLPLLASERSVLSPGERIRFAEARNTIATSRIDAQGQVQSAEVQVDAAKIALERAQRLLAEQAGTARMVDDAQAQMNLAQKVLEAALSRKELVDSIDLEDDPSKLKPLTIEAPREGIVRAEHATAGEVVAPGAPLFEVMDADPIWVRVAVYVGELAELDAEAAATITQESQSGKATPMVARSIAAPPTATPLASTVDLYYELPNPKGVLRPGQRVDVAISLRGQQESTVVPWSAVIHDIQGGTWLYEQTAEHTFVRRRVQVRQVIDNVAVLDGGAAIGAKVVTAGAIELFGAEFGFAK